MIRDPFYRQILERLAGRLDGDLFEVCAASLLRKDFPTLVPVRGGTDSGMDGVTASPGPFLICTTGEDVIGNLTKNLESYKRSGGPRRAAIVATSQELTQRRRANLEDKARSLGFHLRHVYDREAMAERLYHEPHWCKELLGLTGRPSALTTIPRTDRPLLDHPLVGRGEDVKWLRETQGDRLVVGQPGCGKTFLLRSLALEGWGLFLADDDIGAVADALRTQQPRVVIVDDAHLRLPQLTDLRRLRAEVLADFDIVATSWEGDKDQVAEALSLPATKIRALGLLTRDEIVEVVKHTGIAGPTELIREIVNQAEGRPGLAVTLSYLCLNGDVRGVYFGEALSRSLGVTFRTLVGQEANDILGAFALGGDGGMPPQAVAEAIGVPLLQLRARLVRLAAGGVLREDWQGRLSVWPAALRYVLVRDTFFRGVCAMPADALMRAVPIKVDMVETLVGAVGRGAKVPDLIDILEEIGSPDSWREYASLGEAESKFVVRKHPEAWRSTGKITLQLAPAETLPLLFAAAVGDERNTGNALDHPLRRVEDWVREAVPGKGQAVPRRRALVDAAGRWLKEGGDERVGVRAALFALRPTFESGISDPGSGMSFTLTSGLLSEEELRQVVELWDDLQAVLARAAAPDWDRVFSAVTPWAYPEAGRIGPLPAEVISFMRSVAAKMVQDIADLSRAHPGVQQWAKRLADHLQASVKTAEDPDFETLFPEVRHDEWKAAEGEQQQVVISLAERWQAQPPEDVAATIVRLEREAALVGKSWPRWTPVLCARISEATENPGPWLRALVENGAPGDAAEPFLRKAVEARLPCWDAALAKCFESPVYERLAAYVLLTIAGVPDALMEKALAALPRHYDMVETLCLRALVPEPTLRLLLRHESRPVSTAAVVGVWCSDPKGEIPEAVAGDWRAAALQAEGVEYWLPEILTSDRSLAFEWLKLRAGRSLVYEPYEVVEEMKVAASVLDFEQRGVVMGLVGDGYLASVLIQELVGNDLRMYAEVLRHPRFKEYHFAPLAGHPVGDWVEKALMSMDAGYPADEVVDAAFSHSESWTGPISGMWQGWVDDFEALAGHADPRMREVARIGADRARGLRDSSLERERLEAIYGR